MNSDTEETTKVSKIEVSALKETRLATQKKIVLELERHRFAEKVLIPFENLLEDAVVKQAFVQVQSFFARNSICDTF